MTTLDQIIEIAPRFRRSVHLESDFATEHALDGYVVSPLARDLARRIAQGVDSVDGTRAWSLVGPYGSGKSAFLTFIGHLLEGNSTARSLFTQYWPNDDIPMHETLVPVLVTGEQRAIGHSILTAASRAADAYWAGRGKSPQIVSELRSLAAEFESGGRVADRVVVDKLLTLSEQVRISTRDGGGLCVIVDEMGKFLEHAALGGQDSDIYLLQLLAEAAARSSKAPLVLITTLHQGLDSYAEGLPRSRRLEWSKVAGRYETIPFLETPRYLTKLIRGAIAWKTDRVTGVQADVAEAAGHLVANNERLADFDQDDLIACAPLHPITALCLGPLFRTHLGQNERSLFAFLTSREPHGFQDYLRAHYEDASPYSLDELYDYVLANTGARVAGLWDRSWSAAQQALTRLPSDAHAVDARLIKATAVLALVGTAVGLRADAETLALATSESMENVRASLLRLEKHSALVFRQFKGAYQVWDGSDLNIPGLISDRRKKVKAQGGFAERLQKLVQPVPVIATRHYHQTGTLRHLAASYSSVPTVANQWVRSSVGDGDLLYVIPAQRDEVDDARTMVTQPMQWLGDSQRPLVVALPREPEILIERVVDYFAIEDVLANTPELANDPVGRRELQERLLAALDALTDAVERNFTSSASELHWYWRGERITGESRPSACASRIFDVAYTQAPILKNELINRDVLSSHAAGARRVLMEAMMEAESTERLGFEGYPPELSVYRSLFESQGLHRKGGDHQWHFYAPEPGSSFEALWHHLDKRFRESGGQRVDIQKLSAELAHPPFGIREGVAPILLLAFYLTRRDELFVYEDNSFLPVPASDLVPRLLKRPATFEFQWTALGDLSTPLVEALHDQLQIAGSPSVLTVVKRLVRFVAGLSQYASKTQTVTRDAAALRNAIKAARDPMRLLTQGIPEALGIQAEELRSPEGALGVAKRVTNAVLELQALDARLLQTIGARLQRHFGGGSGAEFYALLRRRAVSLADQDFVPMRVRNFVNITATSSGEDDTYMMGAGTAILGKPPTTWSDDDVRHFEYRVLDLARDFIASEEILGTGSSLRGEKVIRVSVVDGDGTEHHGLATFTANDTHLQKMKGLVTDFAEKNGLSNREAAYAVIAGMMEFLGQTDSQEKPR